MKITYLTLIAGLSTGLAISAQPVMAQQGQHRFRQQFHPNAQRQERELQRNGKTVREERQRRTNGNTSERERQREEPNGTVVQQREQERTSPSGQTQTRTQERKIQPNP